MHCACALLQTKAASCSDSRPYRKTPANWPGFFLPGIAVLRSVSGRVEYGQPVGVGVVADNGCMVDG